MTAKTISIIGGTGFLGRSIARRLLKSGYAVKVFSRHAPRPGAWAALGDSTRLTHVSADAAHPSSMEGALRGSFAVINLVGILFETKTQRFHALHTEAAGQLAAMASAEGVERFIQVSALGVDRATDSAYATSKLEGEARVRAAFPRATILRPSVVFGPEDNFFNQFADMSRFSPALPLIMGGHSQFQPVYVEDVAAAVEACLTHDSAPSETYALAGPQVYSFREILSLVLRVTGRTRLLLPLPEPLANVIALAAETLLPRPPLTRDQIRLLKTPNILTAGSLTLADLGIRPAACEDIVPTYLGRKGA